MFKALFHETFLPKGLKNENAATDRNFLLAPCWEEGGWGGRLTGPVYQESGSDAFLLPETGHVSTERVIKVRTVRGITSQKVALKIPAVI